METIASRGPPPVEQSLLMLWMVSCACRALRLADSNNTIWNTGSVREMTQSLHEARRCGDPRACLIVSVASLALLYAFWVRVAQAYSYEVTPIVCDGVDDDAIAPMFCALPEDGTKDPLSSGARIAVPGRARQVTNHRLQVATAKPPRATWLGWRRNHLERPPSQRSTHTADSADPH